LTGDVKGLICLKILAATYRKMEALEIYLFVR
jgi:hypothetical protein